MANEDNNNSSLFSEKQIREMNENHVQASNGGTVTVLGMTFPNENERRNYFRKELRKKLPELRNIEGFPLGDDDDIINLSDPPYYTACPNPWQIDFIAQWEQEKLQLEVDGKRRADFAVVEPFASDVSEGKNNPVYNAHSYHTKVPHPAIMRYILHYTQPGDIIFDGFCGTGMTGVAAKFCESPENDIQHKIQDEFKKWNKPINWGERHAILSDLSPVASLICGIYNSPRNIEKLNDCSKLLNEAEEKYGWLYTTELQNGQKAKVNYVVWSDVFVCPHCGKEIVFYESAVDHNTNTVKKEFSCPNCNTNVTKRSIEKCWESVYDQLLGKVVQRQKIVPVLVNYSLGRGNYFKALDKYDFELIDKSNKLAASFSLFNERMMEGNEARRNDRQGLTHVHHFYFSRSLFILQYLYERCNDIELKFLINSQLINISKLNRYRPGISFPYNPLSGTLYIGSQISEANIFTALRNKLNRLFSLFDKLNAKNVSGVSSATSIQLPDNSIDYIFTDPPFGANISYSELNFIQEAWLRVKTNAQQEAVVNISHRKKRSDYQRLMTLSVKEYYRVLKPGKWMTVEFSNTSAAIWNAIQQALEKAGFVIASVSSLDKQLGSFKAVTTTTAVKQDLIISCYKPSADIIESFKNATDQNQNVWAFIEELLDRLPITIIREGQMESVVERTPRILYDKLLSYYVSHQYAVPIDAHDFQKQLTEYFIERDGMYFTTDQVLEYEEQKKVTPVGSEMSLFVASERDGIEWLRRELIKPKTYSELTNRWNALPKPIKDGDQIPELIEILKENFIKEDDGKWVIPDRENQAHLTIMRNKRLRKQFDIFVVQAGHARRLNDTNLEALRYGFTECYKENDFATIVKVAEKLPESLLMEDEVLLQFYDIAISHV